MGAKTIHVKLATQDPPASTNLKGKSWLLTAMSRFPDDIILAVLAEGLKKSPDLGRLFHELKPSHDGTFTLELGVILPDWFPNLNGQQDYSVDVPLGESDVLERSMT